MKTTSRIAFVTLSLYALTVLAHGGEEHLKGVITKIDGPSLTLKVEKGETVVVLTDAKTEFKRGDAPASLKDVAVGDKAVIHATEHDEKYLAKVVKLSPAANAKSAADAGTPSKQEPGHDH